MMNVCFFEQKTDCSQPRPVLSLGLATSWLPKEERPRRTPFEAQSNTSKHSRTTYDT